MPLADHDAISWDTFVDARDKLRALTFATQEPDEFPIDSIEPEAIVLRKLRRRRHNEPGDENELTPGILLTPGNQAWEPSAGNMGQDDGMLELLVQVILRDNHLREAGLRTILKWQAQIQQQFHCHADWPQDTRGWVAISYAHLVNTVDERFWVPHRLFAGGVYVQFKLRQPQG